jgi:hypothetical protein
MATESRAAVEPVAHTADGVSGDGSEGSPYQQDCSYSTDDDDVCVTPGFPARTLQKLWSHEAVPSYLCGSASGQYSAAAPYLYFQGYAPGGTTLPWGVAVYGLGPIGVSITATLAGGNIDGAAGGTRSASPWSSATNWEISANSYAVQLYCTEEYDDSYAAPGLTP